MDTSKEYINMCEKAKEIQSTVTEEKIEHNFYICCGCYTLKPEDDGWYWCNCNNYPDANKTVWLPRQDQLLSMFNISGKCLYNDHGHWNVGDWDSDGAFDPVLISRWLAIGNGYGFEGSDTPEKALLSAFMKEKYGKVWNNRTGIIVNPDGDNKELEGEGWGWYYAGVGSG